MQRFGFLIAVFVAVAILWASPSLAAYNVKDPGEINPEIFQIDQQKVLGVRLDRDFVMIDGAGNRFTLREKLGKPLVLVLSYYRCDGICGAVNQELLDLMMTMGEVDGLEAGKDFEILTLSFDKDDTLETLAEFRSHLKLPEDLAKGWTFALPEDSEAMAEFAADADYRYFWSPADRTFFHPSAYLFLTPEGRIARVLFALANSADDVKLALLDAKASQFKPSEIINFAVSLCYSYNYKEGRYTYNIPLFIAVGSLSLGVTALSASLVVFRQRRKKGEEPNP